MTCDIWAFATSPYETFNVMNCLSRKSLHYFVWNDEKFDLLLSLLMTSETLSARSDFNSSISSWNGPSAQFISRIINHCLCSRSFWPNQTFCREVTLAQLTKTTFFRRLVRFSLRFSTPREKWSMQREVGRCVCHCHRHTYKKTIKLGRWKFRKKTNEIITLIFLNQSLNLKAVLKWLFSLDLRKRNRNENSNNNNNNKSKMDFRTKYSKPRLTLIITSSLQLIYYSEKTTWLFA